MSAAADPGRAINEMQWDKKDGRRGERWRVSRDQVNRPANGVFFFRPIVMPGHPTLPLDIGL